MQSIDKFGNKIYPKTFAKMKKYARILTQLGYRERNKNKPNLFSKRDEQYNGVCYYADMRGTEEVPIWEDTSPLFYLCPDRKVKEKIPQWLKNRLAKKEFNRLKICRESYDQDLSQYNIQGENGYCIVCGKDFQDNGFYCSLKCEIAHIIKYAPKCRACGKCIVDYASD